MIRFMQSHPNLANGTDRTRSTVLWMELTELLNAAGGVRTQESWQRVILLFNFYENYYKIQSQ